MPATTTSASITANGTADNLPTPHRCPWLVQYLLISPLRRIVEPAEKLLRPYIQPGMTVVEPGCGMGYVSLAAARLVGPGGRLLCVDIEPRAVQRLQRRATRAGLQQRITAQTCAPRSLGLDGHASQVDLAVIIHTLHEFEDLPGTLTQLNTLLKPEGRMLVVEPKGHVLPQQFEAMMVCCEQHGFKRINSPALGKKRLAAVLARV